MTSIRLLRLFAPQAASKSGLEKVKYDAQILLKAAANRCSRKQVLENMVKELAQVIVEQVRSPGVVEPLYCNCKCEGLYDSKKKKVVYAPTHCRAHVVCKRG